MSKDLYPKDPILLIDDDETILKSYELVLRANGFNNYKSCIDSRKVFPLLRSGKFELIILDLSMPYISGNELLPEIRSNFPEIPVVILSGNMETDSVIQCIKEGAFDYVVKPVDEERFLSTVTRAIKRNRINIENRALKEQLLNNSFEVSDSFSDIVTQHYSMISIFKYITAIAKSSEPVLITGETGVGKELMAKAIHLESQFKGEFVPVIVSGLDDNVFSDTLFGHTKGAFTDAIGSRKGLIEEAQGGTLFLDEIGDLSISSQIKLLRILQENEYRQLGSDILKNSDVRIVAATNRNLKELMESGEFRKDLYYRLDVHQVKIPPLRERKEDIRLLINHFIHSAEMKSGQKEPLVDDRIYTALENYSFPGNIRELRSIILNTLSRITGNRIMLSDIDPKYASLLETGKMEKGAVSFINDCFPAVCPTIHEVEHALINRALVSTGGNQTKAAELLGISRHTLIRRIKSRD